MGDSVKIKYITQEVIDESQRLFNEAEVQKAKMLQEKALKRSERKTKTKQTLSNVVDNVKQKLPKSHKHKRITADEEKLADINDAE